MQTTLLRLLQEKVYRRLGGRREEKADVRFVAATNRDLEQMVASGEFREDLFYRLDVLDIWLPPLRERSDDIGDLAKAFCARIGGDNGRPNLRLGDDAIEALCQHEWPGNVRELANVIERLVVYTDGDRISAADVKQHVQRPGPPSKGRPSVPQSHHAPDSSSLAEQREEAEKEAIVDALRRANGNKSQAARLLRISRRTLYNRMVRLDLP